MPFLGEGEVVGQWGTRRGCLEPSAPQHLSSSPPLVVVLFFASSLWMSRHCYTSRAWDLIRFSQGSYILLNKMFRLHLRYHIRGRNREGKYRFCLRAILWNVKSRTNAHQGHICFQLSVQRALRIETGQDVRSVLMVLVEPDTWLYKVS